MPIIKKVILSLASTFLIISFTLFSDASGLPSYDYKDTYKELLESTVYAQAPDISAKGAVLIESSSGKIICAKNENARMPMASTTKIMTAIVALENSELDRIVSVSPLAVGTEGSSIYLYKNEEISMESLIYALMLESANDAAAAIAYEISNSIEGFAELMNKKAQELGLTDTHFDNPHGLDSDTHYTTAKELGIIASYAMKNPTFREIVSTYKKTISLNSTEGVRLLINHNRLLKYYEGTIGIKTGYTKKSGRCLVSAAQRDGVELLCVTLNAPNDWEDHTKMLDYGFSIFESRTLIEPGEFCASIPVISGNGSEIILTNADEVKVTIRKNSGDIKCTVELFRFYFAPINKGDVLGRLVYTLDGEEIGESKIYALSDIQAVKYKKNLFEQLFAR